MTYEGCQVSASTNLRERGPSWSLPLKSRSRPAGRRAWSDDRVFLRLALLRYPQRHIRDHPHRMAGSAGHAASGELRPELAVIGAAQAIDGEAGALIQPVVVAYPNRNGMPVGRAGRNAIAWHGDMDLAPHLWALLGGGTIEAVVIWGEPRDAGSGADRKRLAAELADWARTAYASAIHGLIE